ncbi:DNA alkylation repair protein [Flavihumibacter sp. UBA7668]|uniref:DNA alkylation repair protein n=1 Tax=Flavihumibacter sp. UBA7668 TaxID=1946542 RepID=UPI0025C12416|nr:DNA alkylation repair protein [Flavihumibacter sp. UBA7668]
MSTRNGIKNWATLYKELTEAMEFNRDPAKAGPMAAYMKNRFVYLGISQPLRKELSKPFLIESKQLTMEAVLEMAKQLWLLPEREYQYIAMELLYANRKKWNTYSGTYFLQLVTDKAWWDSVDFIASKLVGTWLAEETNRAVMKEWVKSDNIWQNRTALIFQLNYKNKTDVDFLFSAVRALQHKKEFFVQKAIGWSLRQYHRTSPEQVEEFVETIGLSGLARREALKHAG